MKLCRKKLHTYDAEEKHCPECQKLRSKVWYQKNKQKQAANTKRWRELNSDKMKQLQRSWYLSNKKEISNYEKKRSLEDFNYKLKRSLRTRLYLALKGNFKSGSAVRDLGCTIPELRTYLEARFQPSMTWDNHGAWHLDHIRPLSSFDLTDPEQFRRAVHYTNLQPLWAEENLKKGSRYESI